MKMSNSEKLIVMMLAEIHEKLGIVDGLNPKLVKEAILSGNLWGLEQAYAGLFEAGDQDEKRVDEVRDVLEMWWLLEVAYEKFTKPEKKRVKDETGFEVRFRGFDGNNEGELRSIALFLINHLDSYTHFQKRDLNSHMPSIDIYRRMYRVFEPMRSSLGNGDLSVDQVIEIMRAMVHPSHKP